MWRVRGGQGYLDVDVKGEVMGRELAVNVKGERQAGPGS